MRRAVGIAAFVMALAVLVVLFLSLRPAVGFRMPFAAISRWTQLTVAAPGGKLYSGSGSAPAPGIRKVVVDVPSIGAVQLATGPTGSVSWNWTVTGPRQGAVRSRASGAVLVLTFTPALPRQLELDSAQEGLRVTLPPGLAASVSVATGAAKVYGSYRSLAAHVTTGALSIQDFSGKLTADVDTGPLDVQAAAVQGVLRLQVGTGPLNFSGDPGLASSFSVGTGPLTLRLAPSGQLAVHAAAHLGPLSSGYPGLPGGTNGVFRGTIGHGPRGTLSVDDGTGPVSITPQ